MSKWKEAFRLKHLIRFLTTVAVSIAFLVFAPFINLGKLPLFSSYWLQGGVVILIWFIAYFTLIKSAFKRSPKKASISPDQSLAKQLKNQLQEIKRTLKGLGKKTYDVPWYLIIGESESGKSSLINASGLGFKPVEFYRGDTQGIEWHLGEEALLIQLPGNEMDNAEMTETLVTAICQQRRLQPLNGLLITLSCDQLLTADPEARQQRLQNLRGQLARISQYTGTQIPVYLILTKIDLLPDFGAYFQGFSATERKQSFGVRFDVPLGKQLYLRSPSTDFQNEFDALVTHLTELIVGQAHTAANTRQVIAINNFPWEFNRIREPVTSMIQGLFEEDNKPTNLPLRGVYFTGDDRQKQSEGLLGKGFFKEDLLPVTILREASLAGIDHQALRASQFTSAAVSIIGVAVTAFLLHGWYQSYQSSRAYFDLVEKEIDRAQVLNEQLEGNYKPKAALQLLDTLLDAPQPEAYKRTKAPWFRGLGLAQEDYVHSHILDLYHHTLKQVLLPRLIVSLESLLLDKDLSDAKRKRGYAVYLMLTDDHTYYPDKAKDFFIRVWLARNKGNLNHYQVEALTKHITNLLEENPGHLPQLYNSELILEVLAMLKEFSLEDEVYARIEDSNFSTIKGFSVSNVVGESVADKVFYLKNGEPITQGLLPFFTRQAYQGLFPALVSSAAEEVIESARLNASADEDKLVEQDLITAVHNRYLKEYAEAYQRLLSEVDIQTYSTAAKGASILNRLTATPSPLIKLLRAINRQTNLGEETPQQSSNPLTATQSRLDKFLNRPSSIEPHEDIVRQTFAPLNQVLEPHGENPAPIEKIMAHLKTFRDYLSEVATLSKQGGITPEKAMEGQMLIQKLEYFAETQSALLIYPILESVVEDTAQVIRLEQSRYLTNQWQKDIRRFCTASIENRYPFKKSADAGVPLADFSEFFGYGGMMDKFFNRWLKPFIDTSRSPWRVKANQIPYVRISNETISLFENTARIRQAFFDAGSKKPSFSTVLQPRNLDPDLRSFTLDMNGQVAAYAFGPLRPTRLDWPGPVPNAGIKITMESDQGSDLTYAVSGVWGWFKLLDKMNLMKTRLPEAFTITFDIDGKTANYSVEASSAINPYNLVYNRQFHCPRTL